MPSTQDPQNVPQTATQVAEYLPGDDARLLRDAMGCFATGVTVVTAMASNDEPVGLTANSFTSVSLDPPLVLVCIGNMSGSADILRRCTGFAVNILASQQQDVSRRFAQQGVDRFDQGDWRVGVSGAPVLDAAAAVFDCDRHAVHDGGDHFILVGEVKRALFDRTASPLLYHQGAYRKLQGEEGQASALAPQTAPITDA